MGILQQAMANSFQMAPIGMGSRPQFIRPPDAAQFLDAATPAPVAHSAPAGGGMTDQVLNKIGLGGGGAPAGGGMMSTDHILGSAAPPAAGAPAAPAAPAAGSGVMDSIMKAFNGGAGGGMDPAKLMQMLGALGVM